MMNLPPALRRPLVVLCLLLSACSSMKPGVSTYLTEHPQLVRNADTGFVRYRSPDAIDPAQIQWTDIEWRADDAPPLPPAEREQLKAEWLQRLHEQLSRVAPADSMGRATVLRAAITRVETVSPGLNTALSVLLIGPLDRGGAAVEIELLDAQTRRPLLSLASAHYAPLTELKARFDRLASARWALLQSATEFAELVARHPSNP